MNYRLRLMYEGTRYAGWQRQENAATIQGELEKALAVILREPVILTGVSRTDAGVHAADFTANFHFSAPVDTYKLRRGANALLPPDIRIKQASVCDESFNARFDAVKKTYIYRIDCSPWGDAFYRNFSWHQPYPLDLEQMQLAADCFLGEHDFSGFMAQGSSAKTFTRTITESCFTRHGDLLEYQITGNAFLYNMVRIIAGTLVGVGRGKISAKALPEIILSHDRTCAGMTAPAKGLMLMRAQYDEKLS